MNTGTESNIMADVRAVAEERRMGIQSALVRAILEQWRAYKWTGQGFGFIRTKLANVGRIHIWDSSLATKRVSTMHTHPWPLHSTVISGELINQRFIEDPSEGMPYMRSSIATGEGGGLLGEPVSAFIRSGPPELYLPGDSYSQEPSIIHRSIPQDGTVTLMERPQGPPLEEALVFWPAGTQWVSAEPKELQDWMIEPVISYALARWGAV